MPPESSSREPIPPTSWEGDKMFNIYIYDYCYKRGFRKTAQELLIEAELGSDATPPINARQGLLFEWWSVFWVLFQAKSGNSNHEDAMFYIQHQSAQKAAQRMHAGPGQQQLPGVPNPLGNQPQPSSNPQSQPQVPGRMPNGMPLQRQPSGYHTNGAMPNGINPAMGGQPQPGQMTQPMQGQPGGTLNFGGIGGQPNGAAAQQPPPQGVSQQPGTHPMSFNPMMSGARPLMNGQSQQPGQQQPRGPFTSPPMAHSPQSGAGGGQPPSQGPPPGPPGPPMAQLGPSPQMTPMSRSMLPPNGTHSGSMTGPMNLSNPQQGPPPNNPFNPGQGPQGPHGQGLNPAVRPRSRPTPSPSMSARQPPPQQGGMGMMLPMGQGMPAMGVMNLGMGGGVGGSMNPDMINHEMMSIPNMSLSSLKHELGLGDKDLNMSDKAYIVNVWKQRSAGAAQARKDGIPGMPPPGQPQAPQQIQQRPQQSQQPGSTNRLKRNSTSPPEEQNEQSSPPDRKRVKRSPAQPPPAIPPGYSQHHQPGQPPSAQPPTSTPQQVSMQLNSQPGQPGPGGASQAQMAQQHVMMMRQMGSASGPVLGGQKPGGTAVGQTPTGPQPVGAPMHPAQMHHGHFRGGPPGPGAGRPSGAPQFHPTPLTQLATKPHIGMPANSPGMNGPSSKDGAKDIKRPQSNGQPQQGNQPGPVSPRNTGTAPPTPGASNQPTPGLPPTSLPPPPVPNSGGPNAQASAPQQSPGIPPMLGMPMNLPGMPVMNPGDFMFETNLMDDFEIFNKQEGDINFERDFGQWFNTTEDGGGLELK